MVADEVAASMLALSAVIGHDRCPVTSRAPPTPPGRVAALAERCLRRILTQDVGTVF